jgi:poly-gamma-glutamate capsule biosynthesis protein CapA/YwtB (metallophosphatase superfamily)
MATSEPILLGFNNFKFLKNADTKAITLYRKNDSSGYEPMINSQGGNYLVPADKKLVILHCTVTLSGTSATYQTADWYEHTVAGSSGGSKRLGHYTPMVTGDGANLVYDFNVYVEIASGNYVNTNHDSSLVREIMTGVEVDA